MTRFSLSSNSAAAWGARLAMVNYIPTFPLTPQFEIIEILADWIAKGEMKGKLAELESEQSMLLAAGSAAASGERVFAVTTGKNLSHAMELLYSAGGLRIPIVLIHIARSSTPPLKPEHGHNNVLVARDSGLLQIHCTSCQEVLDSVLLAYRLAEDDEVRLPVVICHDGLNTSAASEPVEIPNATSAKQFIGSYDPGLPPVATSAHLAPHEAGADYRYALHLTSQTALNTYDELADEFRDFFGRYYPAVVEYRCQDADFVFILMGSIAAGAEEAVDKLRDNGWKVGLLRPRLLRPFPQEKIIALLRGKRAVAVVDRHLSLGKGGVLHAELAAALFGQSDVPSILASFIATPGVHEISTQDFFEMATLLRKAVDSGVTPAPRLLLSRHVAGNLTHL